ncbi:hypothetical protein OG21DRAFT_1485253 [Imleria badia]|nr:hypothetical protein OG21DRAFT_1485253 [Imleria badia]
MKRSLFRRTRNEIGVLDTINYPHRSCTESCPQAVEHSDPATLGAGGLSPPELCDAPEIARYFATVIAILGVVEGIISIAGCAVLSHISSHYGRKPAFLLVLIAGVMGSCYLPNWLADWVFLAGMLFEFFSGPLPYAYLVSIYIVDLCVPEDRTAALSKIAGWVALGLDLTSDLALSLRPSLAGTCVSFTLGGSVTTKTGNPVIVFYMATAIYVATFINIASFLTESFPQERRSALSRMHPKPSIDDWTGLAIGDYAWCATHTFVFMAANAYASTAWLVFARSKYHLTPADQHDLLDGDCPAARSHFTCIYDKPNLDLLQEFSDDVFLRLLTGEALAAIEMVSNAGNVLSPIMMGSILTAMVGTTPLLVFYFHLVVVLISSALLFLVRDADRYQKPHEE